LATSTRWALCQGGLLSLCHQILGTYATHAPQSILEPHQGSPCYQKQDAGLQPNFTLVRDGPWERGGGAGSVAVVLGIGPVGRVRETLDCQDVEVGFLQEVANGV